MLEVTDLEYENLECAAVSARGSGGIILSQIGALVFSWGRYGHSLGRQSCQWQRMPVGYCTLLDSRGQPRGVRYMQSRFTRRVLHPSEPADCWVRPAEVVLHESR